MKTITLLWFFLLFSSNCLALDKKNNDFIVYFKNNNWDLASLFFWKLKPSGSRTVVKWPGVRMEKLKNGWYRYNFGKKIKSAHMVFNNRQTKQTKDLFRSQTGWFDGRWHNEMPKDPVAKNDFRRETIYFLLTARFFNGDKSNDYYNRDRLKLGDPQWRGDFKGLIEKLDYIKDLGFSAIWITPPVENRSGLDYHGYHAYDWTRIDPRLESVGAT